MSFEFQPASVAVVGASSDPEKLSNRPVRFLQAHGYEGEIYPVNPNAETVAGLDCYPDVASLPEVPDLAMVMLPAALVEETVEACLTAGVENVVVVSSGFSEVDEAGAAAERRLADLAEAHGAALVGPNSQGVIDVPSGATVSFTPALERDDLRAGSVSFVTQSGAFGGALTTMLQDEGVGLDRWVSTGNEAHRDALDFVVDLADAPRTEVVAGYVEGFADGRTLVELRRTDAGVDLPLVLLKVGQTDRGKAAAASHTGTLAGRHAVYESVFRELGVMAVGDVDQFVDVVRSLVTVERLPGRRLGVVTTSGGAGVHIADVAAAEGLSLPDLDPETRAGVEAHIPEYGSALNPVDITAQVAGDPDAFTECLDLLFAAPDLDAVILQLTNVGGERAVPFAERIAAAAADSETPLFVSWTGGLAKGAAYDLLAEAGVPVFDNPARCVRAVATMARAADARSRLRAARDLPARPPAGPTDGPERTLTEHAAKDLLAARGVPVPDGDLVTDPDEAAAVARRLGGPLVAKLVSPEVAHRNRVGGVRTGLADASAARAACADLLALGEDLGVPVEGVSIQAQVADGLELAAGVADSDFGPVVMLGRGGTEIESVTDAAFRTIPVAREQAAAMLAELETVPALDDATRAAVLDVVDALSTLRVEEPWIDEVDVNPLVVGDGVTAVDALVVGTDGE